MPKSLTELAVRGLAVSLLGAGAFVIYVILNTLRRDEDRLLPNSRQKQCIEVKIPKDCVGALIGRKGANIKDIQEKTDTKITFKDEPREEVGKEQEEGERNQKERICYVRGFPENTQQAEAMILQFIAAQPKLVTATMSVEQRVCGRIIGRGGATIRAMQANSGAKISLEGGPDDTAEDVPRTITIRGTENQVKVAKGLIEEKIEEDMENRRIASCSARTPRSPRRQLAITNEGTNGDESEGSLKNAERLSAGTQQEGFMEVYVAAMKHPGRFWIQKVGPPSVDLDRLVEKMTEFYNQEENRNIFKLQKPLEPKDIVASKFEKDGKWYRALVRDVKPDEYDFNQSMVDLFYVDYGDDEVKSQLEVCMLKSEFLALRTQAIECTIAGVKPASEDGLWSEDASDLFDELSGASCWVPVMAKVKGFKKLERGDRGTSPVPALDIVCNETNIADELVAKGFATKEEPATNGTNGTESPAPPIKRCVIPAGEENWNDDDSDFEM